MFNEYMTESSGKAFAWIIIGLAILVGLFGETEWYVKVISLIVLFSVVKDAIDDWKRGRYET